MNYQKTKNIKSSIKAKYYKYTRFFINVRWGVWPRCFLIFKVFWPKSFLSCFLSQISRQSKFDVLTVPQDERCMNYNVYVRHSTAHVILDELPLTKPKHRKYALRCQCWLLCLAKKAIFTCQCFLEFENWRRLDLNVS